MLISFSLLELFSHPVNYMVASQVQNSPSKKLWKLLFSPILLFLDPETLYNPEISGVCSSESLPDSKFHLKCGQESPVKSHAF